VLSWRPVEDPERPVLRVLLHEDRPAQQVYFLALLAPPARRAAEPGVPREVVLLVDHSGSMQGPKWEAADWAVKRFLAGLAERDAFALGLFHDKTTWLGKAPKAAAAKAVQKAVEFLEKHQDTGGTELGVALEQALDLQRTDGEAARHVLILTDAEVSDAGRILRLADAEAKQGNRRRIDVLCIDAAPNSFLARELAERGGGVAKFLTSDPEEEDITTALDEVLVDWGQPVATGLRLEVNSGGRVEAAGHAIVEQGKKGSAVDLGDLPAGRAVWIVGRVARGQAAEMSFKVLTAAGREVAGCRLDLKKQGDDHPAIKALFGARRILGLEYLVTSGYEGTELTDQLARLGYDPNAVLADRPKKKAKVYAENVRADAAELLKKLLVTEALYYGLACSETAFVAVRSEKGKPVGETVVVANALPSGWSESFLSRGLGGMGQMLCCLSDPAPAAGIASVDSYLMELDDNTVQRALSPSMAPPPLPSAPPMARAMRASSVFAGAPAMPEPVQAPAEPLFLGVPHFKGKEAVLFDSARPGDANRLPDTTTLVRLQVDFPSGRPDAARLDAGLALLLYVDDLAVPRARVRLADLLQQGGVRPLNIRRRSGERVRLVLADPAGAWAAMAPALEVTLHGA
jgi:Ca-activated chloride channel family protein